MSQVHTPLEREPLDATARKRLSAAQRCEILERQHDLCAGCRETLIWSEVDGKTVYGPMIDEHVIPLELGGSNDLSNRELRCVPCAKAKTKKDHRDIAHVRRMRLKANGEFPKAKQQIRSRGFDKRWSL
jgi:5-methylcytosine-specific restriction endonuclease McrA